MTEEKLNIKLFEMLSCVCDGVSCMFSGITLEKIEWHKCSFNSYSVQIFKWLNE